MRKTYLLVMAAILTAAGLAVSAAFSPQPLEQLFLNQNFQNAFQIFFGYPLAGGDCIQRDEGFGSLFRQIDHHPQGVSSLR